MAEHELKTWPMYFCAIADGTKTFEVRKDDRDFTAGDRLTLREYVAPSGPYTGREITAEVGYVLRNCCAAIPDMAGHCVFSLLKVDLGGDTNG